MVNYLILILVLVFLVILASLFAGAETGIYQLSRLRLRLGIENKRLPFIILGRTLQDSSALLISMLIGTNLTYYIITSIVTFLFLSRLGTEHAAEFFATLVTAPLLFVFCELIPKNIFFYRSDTLMPCIAPVLFIFHKIFSFCGLVSVLKVISRSFGRLVGLHIWPAAAITSTPKHHISAIMQDTRDEEFLSPVQTDIINRLIKISNIPISSAMTPISKVQTVDIKSDNSVLLDRLKQTAFTRLPVYEHQPANIIGFINIYDCLSSLQRFTDLRRFLKPIRTLAADTVVTEAINIMQSEKQKIVLVTRASHLGRQKPVGIVTMKDLAEQLLGELTEG